MRACLLLLALLLPVACDEAPPEPVVPGPTSATDEPAWPAGTVLAIGGLPLSAEEVDQLADAIGSFQPGNVRLQNRRLALTNHFLEQYAVRARDGAGREAALLACREALVGLEGGEEDLVPESVTGDLMRLRAELQLWATARTLEPGRWVGPLELIGRWVLVRLDEREEGVTPQLDWLELSVLSFPFLDCSYQTTPDRHTCVQDAVAAAELVIVDPTWGEVIPAEWQYRMRGDR